MNIETCREWIAIGKRSEALEWLLHQPDSPDVLVLKALCSESDLAQHWKRAIDALSLYAPSKDLLLALGQGYAQARRDSHSQLQEHYLHRLIDIANGLDEHIQHIHWTSILANFYLRSGYVDKALPLLQRAVQLSLAHQHHLVTIAQGLILTGIWFGKGEIQRVAALSLSIEDAAKTRQNWIAFATARNTRASCLLIQRKQQEAIQLLLETGDTLFEKGAVAALNIVKARLGELHLLLGAEHVRSIVNTLQSQDL